MSPENLVLATSCSAWTGSRMLLPSFLLLRNRTWIPSSSKSEAAKATFETINFKSSVHASVSKAFRCAEGNIPIRDPFSSNDMEPESSQSRTMSNKASRTKSQAISIGILHSAAIFWRQPLETIRPAICCKFNPKAPIFCKILASGSRLGVTVHGGVPAPEHTVGESA